MDSKNYKKKLDNLSRVLVELGTSEVQKNSPVIIGACEIENRRVLEDLVKHPTLINKGYKIVHFDSPDKEELTLDFYTKKNIFNLQVILIFHCTFMKMKQNLAKR